MGFASDSQDVIAMSITRTIDSCTQSISNTIFLYIYMNERKQAGESKNTLQQRVYSVEFKFHLECY